MVINYMVEEKKIKIFVITNVDGLVCNKAFTKKEGAENYIAHHDKWGEMYIQELEVV